MERDIRLSNALLYCAVGPAFVVELLYCMLLVINGMLTLNGLFTALLVVAITIVPIKVVFVLSEIQGNIFSVIIKFAVTLVVIIVLDRKVVYYVGEKLSLGSIWNNDLYHLFFVYQFCIVTFAIFVFLRDIKNIYDL